ncbi:hypothetical protein HK405_010142 [Cladochytrium tenue]|nr:hypothetical protein HK405_010142 [Cladochytrium tenue]
MAPPPPPAPTATTTTAANVVEPAVAASPPPPTTTTGTAISRRQATPPASSSLVPPSSSLESRRPAAAAAALKSASTSPASVSPAAVSRSPAFARSTQHTPPSPPSAHTGPPRSSGPVPSALPITKRDAAVSTGGHPGEGDGILEAVERAFKDSKAVAELAVEEERRQKEQRKKVEFERELVKASAAGSATGVSRPKPYRGAPIPATTAKSYTLSSRQSPRSSSLSPTQSSQRPLKSALRQPSGPAVASRPPVAASGDQPPRPRRPPSTVSNTPSTVSAAQRLATIQAKRHTPNTIGWTGTSADEDVDEDADEDHLSCKVSDGSQRKGTRLFGSRVWSRYPSSYVFCRWLRHIPFGTCVPCAKCAPGAAGRSKSSAFSCELLLPLFNLTWTVERIPPPVHY